MRLNFYAYLALRALRALCLVAMAPLLIPVFIAVWLLLEVAVIPVADWIAKVKADWKERQ